MKTTYITILSLLIIISIGCKKNTESVEKKQIAQEKTIEENEEIFVIKPENTTVKWTAYKTTDRKPVKGKFKVLNFGKKTGSSVEETLNGLNFSIPVSSLFSNNSGRDSKLKELFFGIMDNTTVLEGTIKYTNQKCIASVTMNNITKELPLEVSIKQERRVTLKGSMNLENWDALKALASLNKACYELHKGSDGVSKTWEDVSIEVSTFLRNK